jgi:hypothetical protein
MASFSTSQAWDNVNVNAGHDFNFNFSVNGSGDITEMKERGMDHSQNLVSPASNGVMACRKAAGDHGACELSMLPHYNDSR